MRKFISNFTSKFKTTVKAFRAVFHGVKVFNEIHKNFPGFDDLDVLRQWCLNFCTKAEVLAEMTKTTVDDALLASVERCLSNDKTWDYIKIIVNRISAIESGGTVSGWRETAVIPLPTGEPAFDISAIGLILAIIRTAFKEAKKCNK